MLIECPSCHARAQLPESKEGAKVRCGECGRVYVARAPGSRNVSSGKGSGGLTAGLVGGGLVLVLVVAWFYNRGDNTSAAPPVTSGPEEVDESPADFIGWDSKPVVCVRDFYSAVRDYDGGRVEKLLAKSEAWAFVQNRDRAEEAEEVTPVDFMGLDELERIEAVDALVDALLKDREGDALARWKPVDGRIVNENETDALVHVQVDLDDPDAEFESRTMAFRLLKQSGVWRVAGWERYISPEEQRAAYAGRPKEYEKVELSDGSQVYVAEPRPLEHLEDTPQELRDRIDALYAKLIDLDLTTEAAEARDQLVEIGKPAIPVLLTGLYEIPLDTMDNAIRVNNIVIALRDITGEYQGYKPMELAGSTTGTTAERREAAIQQWFAWWFRKGARFERAAEPEVDPLEALIELDEREKRALERDRRAGG